MIEVVFQPLYIVAVAGIVAFLLLVFEALVGLKVIKFGRTQWRTHRAIAFTLIALTLGHGVYAMGTLLFGWF
jgi:hypothetical protein